MCVEMWVIRMVVSCTFNTLFFMFVKFEAFHFLLAQYEWYTKSVISQDFDCKSQFLAFHILVLYHIFQIKKGLLVVD